MTGPSQGIGKAESSLPLKSALYLLLIAIAGATALLARAKMIRAARDLDSPSTASYIDALALAYPQQIGSFAYPRVEDLANAGRDLLGKEAVAQWLTPIFEAGWSFKGCNDAGLPGDAKSAVFVFEKDGQRALLFGQPYYGIPDLKPHRGRCLTMKSKAPIAQTLMFWGGGGVVYYATSEQVGAASNLATAFGWPAPTGEWQDAGH